MEGEIHIPAGDRAQFYMNPYDLVIHKVNVAKGIDATWKAHTGHDSDEGVRAHQDCLLSKCARLAAEVDEALKIESETEALVASYQEDVETVTAERDAWKRQEEELQSQLRTASHELERTSGLISTTRTEVEAAHTEKEILEDELKRKAGDAVDRAHEGYRKGLVHVRFVHDLPLADYPLFRFDREVKDGKLIRYRPNRKHFDVLYPRSQ